MSLTDVAFLEKLGGWLGFGTIGLGLGLALLSTILLTLRPNPRLYLISTLLSAFIISFGGGIELYRAIQKAKLDEASLSLQNYFGAGAWSDLAEAISLKFSGSKDVTGSAVSKLLKKEDSYIYPLAVPGGECRYIIAIAQPPSDVIVAPTDGNLLEADTDDRSFYKWITICNKGKEPKAQKYEIKLLNSDGMVRVSTYKDRTIERSSSEPADEPEGKPPIRLTVCQGEYLGNCPEKPDVFYGCGSPWGDGIASVECRKRGYPDGAGAFFPRVTVGGNKCGYSIADVTCG
ncbi:hypothetical protein GOB27_30395 [Sinorhizobium meliloti]|nr:hypothetical protein [Sinorhizobium meliloti]